LSTKTEIFKSSENYYRCLGLDIEPARLTRLVMDRLVIETS